MNKLIITNQKVLFFILLFINTLNLQAHTGRVCAISTKYVEYGFNCKWSREELIASKEYQIASICEKFIQENYSNIKYPVYLMFCIKNTTDTCYQISYDTRNFGGALDTDVDYYKKMLKDKNKFSKIGINIWVHLHDSPESVLKLLEYGIKEEPRLRKQLKKLRRVIETKGDTTSQENDTLVIYKEKLLEILAQPPSKRLTKFLNSSDNLE